MKIIDDKGKVLGLVNLVDLLVVLVVLLVAAVLYVRLLQPADSLEHKTKEVEVVFRYEAIDPREASGLWIGDQLIASNRLQPVYVTDIDVRPEVIFKEVNGQLVEFFHPERQIMEITVTGEAEVTGLDIFMASQIVKVGREFIVKTLTTEFKARVVEVRIGE